MRRQYPVRAEERRCQVCGARSAYLTDWEGKARCRDCLRDLLLRAPKGRKRLRLLRLIDAPEWAQGILDFEEDDNGR